MNLCSNRNAFLDTLSALAEPACQNAFYIFICETTLLFLAGIGAIMNIILPILFASFLQFLVYPISECGSGVSPWEILEPGC